MAEPKIVLWDLETSYNQVAVFKLFGEDYIPPENILKERFIICGSWKVLGENPVHTVSVLNDQKRFKKDHCDDYVVCQDLHKMMREADVLVAHNGDSFDTKFAETRMLVHGFDPLPPISSIDTLKVAKDRFLLNSNKLDYIAQLLKVGKKKPTTNKLWLRILEGDRTAIREMIAYNRQDVLVLEKVFNKLTPYMKAYINRELFGGSGCPRCGSTKVQSRGTHKAISNVYTRFQCQSCGGWFRQSKAVNKRAAHRVL